MPETPLNRDGSAYPLDPRATNASSYTIHLDLGHDLTAAVEHGPLCRLQECLWGGPLWWLGNRVSDVRYWLWRLCR